MIEAPEEIRREGEEEVEAREERDGEEEEEEKNEEEIVEKGVKVEKVDEPADDGDLRVVKFPSETSWKEE